MDLLIYLPAGAGKPVPLLLNLGFSANNTAVNDPNVKVGTMWDRKQNQRVPATRRRIRGLERAAGAGERVRHRHLQLQ